MSLLKNQVDVTTKEYQVDVATRGNLSWCHYKKITKSKCLQNEIKVDKTTKGYQNSMSLLKNIKSRSYVTTKGYQSRGHCKSKPKSRLTTNGYHSRKGYQSQCHYWWISQSMSLQKRIWKSMSLYLSLHMSLYKGYQRRGRCLFLCILWYWCGMLETFSLVSNKEIFRTNW